MQIIEIFKSSLINLTSNKIRSFLTMLGVIIGVFSVVSLISLVQGIQNYVVDQFNSLGSNLILISPGRASFENDPALAFTNNKLNEKHVDLIREYSGDYVVGVTPNIRVGKNVEHKTNKYFATIIGGGVEAAEIVNIGIEEGKMFTKLDEDSKTRVAIIGQKIRNELYGPNTNPLGMEFKLNDKSFEIIGLMVPKGGRLDERVLIPYTTAQDILDVDNFSAIATKAKDQNELDLTVKNVELALMRDLEKDDFTVLSQKDILESVESILNILSIGLAAIAGISLLVGGIGIMNIMLVSVTERTREIGLRKAIGAAPNNIAVMFMAESSIISVIGGIIGLSLGFLLTYSIRSYVRAEIPWWAVLLSFGFSLLVGIAFGTYPAIKASKKDPIEALRYE